MVLTRLGQMDESTNATELSEPDVNVEPTDGPSVDALESQLNDVQKAMDQLQEDDLDGAEATIAGLEPAIDGDESE